MENISMLHAVVHMQFDIIKHVNIAPAGPNRLMAV